ncbi:hypothetical protein MNAN1_000453 [Malassezia nana]|uniref:Uncharacterized protein n=1 Tax=Malassezia nana TaxID=180528 RepID=A0AAF0J2D0_9BASI|nr:hypothetical protein MNAN1_000453 [Malassezia nana]
MADTGRDAPPSLTDPALFLGLVPRVQEIGRLLAQVRAAPIERTMTDATPHPPPRDGPSSSTAVPESQGANLALGTMNDNDDDWDPWTAAEGTGVSTSHIPSELQTQLAQEATALQRTLAQAHAALDAAPGADMSMSDQEDLLARLEAYSARQAYV